MQIKINFHKFKTVFNQYGRRTLRIVHLSRLEPHPLMLGGGTADATFDAVLSDKSDGGERSVRVSTATTQRWCSKSTVYFVALVLLTHFLAYAHNFLIFHKIHFI
jgi:uncharacterized GH25 family protein